MSKVFIKEASKNPNIKFILVKNLNYWDLYWESNYLISYLRQGDKEKLIKFLAEFNLIQLL